jgi:hypothetical protein
MERSGRYRVEARGATPPTTQLPGERGSARAAPPTRSTGPRAGANRRLRPSSVQQRGRSRSAIAEAAWLRIANGESGDAIGRDATRTPVSECSSRRPGCRSRWSPWEGRRSSRWCTPYGSCAARRTGVAITHSPNARGRGARPPYVSVESGISVAQRRWHRRPGRRRAPTSPATPLSGARMLGGRRCRFGGEEKR